MRIYWHQGGLRVEPENTSETTLLNNLVKCVKVGEPPELVTSGSGECSDLAYEFGLHAFMGAQKPTPCGFPGEPSHQQSVICINERR